MNKFKLLAPALCLFAVSALTSCTAVVDPAPATTSTTVQRQTTLRAPAADTTTTTTHSTGGY